MIRRLRYRDHACIELISYKLHKKLIILYGENTHQKRSQKEQGEMAKLISRFTNNEECPFWPLFL